MRGDTRGVDDKREKGEKRLHVDKEALVEVHGTSLSTDFTSDILYPIFEVVFPIPIPIAITLCVMRQRRSKNRTRGRSGR